MNVLKQLRLILSLFRISVARLTYLVNNKDLRNVCLRSIFLIIYAYVDKSNVFIVLPLTLTVIQIRYSGHFFSMKQYFILHLVRLPISASVTFFRVSDCALFPASPRWNRAVIVWADTE